jgi:hypothetical protein
MSLSMADLLHDPLRHAGACPPAILSRDAAAINLHIVTAHFHSPLASAGDRTAISAASEAPKTVLGCPGGFPEPTVEIAPAAGKV